MTRSGLLAAMFFLLLIIATAALGSDVDIPGLRDCYGFLSDVSECH